eukprot:TRINITY_DN2580_c0_g1_i1.p1 TRINITY_DN2580_c0_g1~~TRINITY_DN2580_c0_g1_i1.p1  ORF type:complete len:125 (+),score=30.17 TRINITY_DN2580_c0_g1_i1:175-549(+)
MDMHRFPDKTYEAALEAGLKAIGKGADTLILGCTGSIGLAPRLQQELNIPVLEGSSIGFYTLENMIRLNLSQSKKWFGAPDNVVPLTDEEYQQYQEITYTLVDSDTKINVPRKTKKKKKPKRTD